MGASTFSAAQRALVCSGLKQAISLSCLGVSPSSVNANSFFLAQLHSSLIELLQPKQRHQRQAAIRHCWCYTRIRRVVGPWYQQHSWQSSRLAALQSTGALKLTQKDSNHKVNRDKKVATIKSVALFGFFFNAIRVSQQLSLRTR